VVGDLARHAQWRCVRWRGGQSDAHGHREGGDCRRLDREVSCGHGISSVSEWPRLIL
jgi:hypothetical protein